MAVIWEGAVARPGGGALGLMPNITSHFSLLITYLFMQYNSFKIIKSCDKSKKRFLHYIKTIFVFVFTFLRA